MVIVLKAGLVWVCIACLAIANGLMREFLFVPLFGTSAALPLSGLSLGLIIFAVTFIAIGFIGATGKKHCLLIGTQWLLMTLSFELLFGHFVAGKPWAELMLVFNLTSGDLFLLVLLASFVSPFLVARIKGMA